MIDRATGGALSVGAGERYARTFRELGRRGLAGMPLWLVTSDLISRGARLDQRPTVWQAMFHPDILRTDRSRCGCTRRPKLIYLVAMARRSRPGAKSGRLHFQSFALAGLVDTRRHHPRPGVCQENIP